MSNLQDIVDRVDPGNGAFRVDEMADGAFVQYGRLGACAKTGKTEFQRGRKWYISRYMTEDEIFRTCLLAVLIFEQHEVYERFKVDDKVYLNPHPEGTRVEGKVTWETLF